LIRPGSKSKNKRGKKEGDERGGRDDEGGEERSEEVRGKWRK
jgi:hypothetical protein